MEAPWTCCLVGEACCERKWIPAGALVLFAAVGHSGNTSTREGVAVTASGAVGLASPPASGAEQECYGELPGQSCGVSLRGNVQVE